MDDETRTAVAQAILERGSPRFTVPDGAMLDLLTTIAERGDLAAFSEACHAYVAAFPKSRRVLEDYAPAKLLNSHLCRQPGVQSKALRLRDVDPEWAERIKGALWSPLRLRAVVEDVLERLNTVSASAPSSPAS